MLEEPIAELVRKCLEGFSLLKQVEDSLATDSDRKAVLEIAEEDARFKIWSGNIGAHSTGRRSLQYRLRDASHLQEQVKSLLGELSELLRDAYAIAIGEKVPWDHIEDDKLSMGSDYKSDSDDMPATEMGQIGKNVSDLIDCMLRLSVAIRNPAPHDRFATSVSIDASHYEPFDVQHVTSKFSDIESFLADRLGRAISRRRHYFKYRERHHLKLSQGLNSSELNDAESTVASSIPQCAKAAGFNTEGVYEDGASDMGVTQTSLASSHAGGDKLSIPPLPSEAEDGPFECPFCYMMIIATNSISWKRHVLADLRPYVCLSKDCTASGMEFMRRREWILHEVQNHWRTYPCPCACGAVFPAKTLCQEHVIKSHSNAFLKDQVNPMIDLSSEPIKVEGGLSCPLCKEPLHSTKEYQRHVGRHQEQLALFALPLVEYEADDGRSEKNASGENGSTSSEDVHAGATVMQNEDSGPADEVDEDWMEAKGTKDPPIRPLTTEEWIIPENEAGTGEEMESSEGEVSEEHGEMRVSPKRPREFYQDEVASFTSDVHSISGDSLPVAYPNNERDYKIPHPADHHELAREIEAMWTEGDRLPAQPPKPTR